MPPRSLPHCIALTLALVVGLAGTLRAQPRTFAPIVKAQQSKVVHINTRVGSGPGGGSEPLRPFRFPEPDRGQGSGFIISADGFIVTNHHVVEDADEIEVVLADERIFSAEIVGLDAQTDLALLRIEASGLPAAEFGDSRRLAVGDWVVAIGNPLGLDHTVTAGIISAKGRNIFNDQNLAYGEFLQTDAAINPGNSGGPLFNLEGKVVGVNSAISRKGQGIGFAVPSNLVVRVIEQLREHGRVHRGWLGVVIRELNSELADQLVLPAGTRGVVINEVLPDSPAQQTGLRAGDVITAFDAERLRKVTQLQKLVALTPPGNEVELRGYRRAGDDAPWQPLAITVRIGTSPETAAAGEPSLLSRLGIDALNIPRRLREQAELEQGVGVLVESVTAGGLGERVGLQPGDIIIRVDRTDIGSREALETALREARSERISLVVKRDNKVLYLVLDRSALSP